VPCSQLNVTPGNNVNTAGRATTLSRSVNRLDGALTTIGKLTGVGYELVNHPCDKKDRVLTEQRGEIEQLKQLMN